VKRIGAALLILAACADPVAPAPDGAVCPEGVSRAALTAVDRKIVGPAAAYAGDGTLRGRTGELARSQRARREVAWATVAKVLAPLPLAEELPSGLPATIPAWQSWYDKDDLRRVFHRLYAELDADEKAARAPFSAAALDDGFAWNTHAVEELPNWPLEHYLEYLTEIDREVEVAGLGGLSRARYSPAAARHLVASYPEVLGCHDGGAPPPVAEGPVKEQLVERARVVAASCEAQRVGAYVIDAGETLRAALEEGSSATLLASAGRERCSAGPGEVCEIAGPATVEVAVRAGEAAVDAVVEVTRASAHPPWAGCLEGTFTLDAAVVKADYRRADFESTLPIYSTAADALAARMQGDVSWEEADGEERPSAREIYTMTTPGGATYRLAGLHLMTKELDHWLWITLWWSPEPDEDFGADRPASIEGIWKNYKMCAVTAFEEGDPAPGGGFEADHPTLAAALAAVHGGEGGPSWCSNPYLEKGHGNAGSSCIGCHQHGGTELSSEAILELPAHGRTLRRNNFPSDYSWGVTSGDLLEQLYAGEEAYYAR
jgi:hypothetical protein